MADRKPRELIFAFAAVLFITLVYLGMNFVLGKAPTASSFYGHSMGVVGFLLMVMTETLYTLRKRSRLSRWGQMSTWLEFHIFTGIVGPYLVLLHSSWKFNGVAGVLTLMTGVIVLSGFIGRYIYTSVPRTADGIMLETDELERQITEIETRVQVWASRQESLSPSLVSQMEGQATGTVSTHGRLDRIHREKDRELKALQQRRETLRRQMGSLQTARRLLATWHAIHVPIGLGLFALAFVHIAAAIYYSVLLH